MRFQLATILGLAMGSLAALQQNELCGDSVECQTNCYEGRYHIVVSEGSTFFGCKLDDATQYEVNTCKSTKGADITETLCGGGKYCSKGCVLTAEQSHEFGGECSRSNGNPIGVQDATTYDKALEAAGCNV